MGMRGRLSWPANVDGFSLMDNHLHTLVRLEPDVAQEWPEMKNRCCQRTLAPV